MLFIYCLQCSVQHLDVWRLNCILKTSCVLQCCFQYLLARRLNEFFSDMVKFYILCYKILIKQVNHEYLNFFPHFFSSTTLYTSLNKKNKFKYLKFFEKLWISLLQRVPKFRFVGAFIFKNLEAWVQIKRLSGRISILYFLYLWHFRANATVIEMHFYSSIIYLAQGSFGCISLLHFLYRYFALWSKFND